MFYHFLVATLVAFILISLCVLPSVFLFYFKLGKGAVVSTVKSTLVCQPNDHMFDSPSSWISFFNFLIDLHSNYYLLFPIKLDFFFLLDLHSQCFIPIKLYILFLINLHSQSYVLFLIKLDFFFFKINLHSKSFVLFPIKLDFLFLIDLHNQSYFLFPKLDVFF